MTETTPTKHSELYIVPPDGPLSWLYPELFSLNRRAACSRDSGKEEVQTGDRILDLTMDSLSGSGLRERILESHPDRIRIEEGPRGRSLWMWLVQELRREGIDVTMPGCCPPPYTPEKKKDTKKRKPLESILAHAAEAATAAEQQEEYTAVIEGICGGAFDVRAKPLSVEQAKRMIGIGGAAFPWLLPLVPSAGLKPRLENVLNTVSRDPCSFSSAGLLPYFVTEPPLSPGDPEPREPARTRLLLSWWGILPGDRFSEEVRRLFHELMRLLYPDRFFFFESMENYAMAGVDLYTEGLMARFTGRECGDLLHQKNGAAESDKGGLPLIIGVCGTDGSGKSSHVEALREYIESEGLKVGVRKIYRHGIFHDTVTDLTRQCADTNNLHLWRLQRIIKAFDSVKYFCSAVQEDFERFDVLIFDRYIYTHFAAGAGRYHHDPFSQELLGVYPEADRIYLLDVPSGEALLRIHERDEKTVDENPYMLSRYRHVLRDLGEKHGFLILDALDSFEKNRGVILDDAMRLLRARGLGGVR